MARRSRIWSAISVLVLLSILVSTVPAFAQDGIYLPFMQGQGNGTPQELRSQSSGALVPGESLESYIVLMSANSVLDLEHASAAVSGQSVDVNSAGEKNARKAIEKSHAKTLASIGVDSNNIINNYTYAFNGFSATLTEEEAKALEGEAGVQLVLKDQMRYPTTDSSPTFLGLTNPAGPYAMGYTGENIVVGVIDTGIWPEHPSFADDGSYGPSPVTLDDSRPTCEFGNTAANPDDAPFSCNNKLIGARQMLDTYRYYTGADPDEYDSARDDNGHGTHTASTAAGNAGVQASIYGISRGTISGIAPRARIIAYKALGNLGGYTSDLAAAIDQAVADGVDVINYSIGGGAGGPAADEIAFLFAANAGVFVATSAGNDGPDPETLGNPGTMPWMTTVGASTQSRFFQGTVILGNGAEYTGASITTGIGNLPLVDAELAGSDLCVPGALDPNAVAGKIVLCRRGAIARAAKSEAVDLAGGAGMILYNNDDTDNLFTDLHAVPSVHVDYTPGIAIKEYIASDANPTAQIVAEQVATWPYAPSMTIFSSRGPNPVSGAEDIIKPDVTAPGLQILAGWSPTPDPGEVPGELFAPIAGTSMSSPHVAGLFALLKQAHPDWTAAMAKSALMTTAYQDVLDNDRMNSADPFDFGAGHVNPGETDMGSAFQPSIAYDAGLYEYAAFTCGADWGVFSAASCAFLESIGVPSEGYNLNVPSIGVAKLAGSQTIVRSVTNVAEKGVGALHLVPIVEMPEGFNVEVSPSVLVVPLGRSATYTVKITNVSAPIEEWRFGSLTWVSDTSEAPRKQGVSAYSPIAVKAAEFAAPAEINVSGASGSTSFDVSFGYTGDYAAAPHGLTQATVTSKTVVQDPDQTFDPTDGYSVGYEFDVQDALYFRIAMPPDSVPNEDADLDIFVYDPNGVQVASSTAGGTDELVDIMLPENGTWTVYVHGWSVPGGSMPFNMWTWIVPDTSGGSLVVDSAPTSATQGATEPVAMSWSGLTTGTDSDWYLGAVSHLQDSNLVGLTLVNADSR